MQNWENMEVAAREAQAAGDGSIFLEKYIERPHHIEANPCRSAWHVIHLGERDCSIQRRHQKLIETAPVDSDASTAPRNG